MQDSHHNLELCSPILSIKTSNPKSRAGIVSNLLFCEFPNFYSLKYYVCVTSQIFHFLRLNFFQKKVSITTRFHFNFFYRTSKEISDLEGELLSIRNLLSTQVSVIHALADGVHIDSLSSSSKDSKKNISTIEDKEQSDVEKWAAEYPDILDVLLAERRVDEALDAFDEGETAVAEAKVKKTLAIEVISRLQACITSRRQKLSDQLAEAACQSSTCGVELRAAAASLKRLGDGHRGHKLILNAHHQKLQYNMQTIHPTTTTYGGAYTAALSQQVFSAIAQALDDSLDVFGDGSIYTSELVIWATKQTEDFACLVKRHALASSAAAGGLRAAAECVQISIRHCSLLEVRGLALSSVLMKLFRPSIEQALDANLKRIEQSTAALAAADDWSLTYPQVGARSSIRFTTSISSSTLSQPKLSSSAYRFYSMVQVNIIFFRIVNLIFNQ